MTEKEFHERLAAVCREGRNRVGPASFSKLWRGVKAVLDEAKESAAPVPHWSDTEKGEP